MDLLELKRSIDEARSFWLARGTIEFKCRIPTKIALASYPEMPNIVALNFRIICDHVCDWRGMTPRAFGNDSDEPLPFDRDLLREYLADRVDDINALIVGIWDKFDARHKETEADIKN